MRALVTIVRQILSQKESRQPHALRGFIAAAAKDGVLRRKSQNNGVVRTKCTVKKQIAIKRKNPCYGIFCGFDDSFLFRSNLRIHPM